MAMPWGIAKARWLIAMVVAMLLWTAFEATAQRRQRGTVQQLPQSQRVPADRLPNATPAPIEPFDGGKETVQADVSTRQVSVTSSFTGTEVVVFGAVDNSRQPSPESGYYDVVVVIEGAPAQVVTRKKSNIGGLWLNTQSLAFDYVPSYYAIASTRPVDEVADDAVLKRHEIGFENVRMVPARGEAERHSPEMLAAFREAVVRLKERDGLFVQEKYGAVFIGRSLFRASIDLPANVSVGPFDTKVYLFRDGELLSQYTARLNLEREGLERFLHGFAFGRPFLYGVVTVIIAIAAGLAASAVFTKASH